MGRGAANREEKPRKRLQMGRNLLVVSMPNLIVGGLRKKWPGGGQVTESSTLKGGALGLETSRARQTERVRGGEGLDPLRGGG